MSVFEPEPKVTQRTSSSKSEEPRLLTRQDAAAPAAKRVDIKRNSPRHRLLRPRTLYRIMAALTTLTLLLVVCAAMYLRHTMHASLPQLDGTLHAPGLSAPVTVTRDDHGVPSITAANLDDALFAQGFVTAQDRLWQMDALRRHAAGELAEVLGKSLIAHDRQQRVLQLRATADRALAVLPPDQLHQLEAYARGVNAFLTQNGDHLPVEFHFLHYKPAPWLPRDSLLVGLAMFQDLGTDFPTKLLRESLSAHLPPELLADLYPVGSWRDHPPGPLTPDLTSPRPEIEQVPLDETQSKLAAPTTSPQGLLAAQAASLQQTCEGCRSGSNNWAVAGSRSASGLPLVSNDMHLGLGVPDTWYEASLHVNGNTFDVAGLTLPGTPCVTVGRNAHVAWSFTNLGGDVQDLYIEHLRNTGDATEFQRPDGSWSRVAHHAELIKVRGSSDVQLDVLTSTRRVGNIEIPTPILSPLYPTEKRAVSLAWTAYDPANLNTPFCSVNNASTGVALTAAFDHFGGPALNLVYADDQNHIGFHVIGRIPIRGAAVHHPVILPNADLTSEPDEDDQARIASHSPFTLAAYVRPARRKQIKPKPAPDPEPIPPLPAPLGYTIGSPIPPVPVDALSADAQWSGYIPYAELPAVVDPPGGILATANARVTADDYPYAIAIDWAPPYRLERIVHLLAQRSNLTPADMLHIEMDVHSELDLALAHRIAYALDQTAKTSPNAKHLRQAADILRHWDGNVDANAAAPTILSATRAELWPMLLVPQIAAHDRAAGLTRTNTKPEALARLYSWAEQSYVLEQLLLHSPSRWLPPGVADWNTFLTIAVDHALTNAHAPSDLNTWAYGKSRPVELNHPLLSPLPLIHRVLGVTVGSGQRAIGGDTSTVKAAAHTFGPTERFTADLADPNATTLNLTTGQSGNPASPWYLDQLPLWLGGTTLPLPLHNSPATHTLTLQP